MNTLSLLLGGLLAQTPVIPDLPDPHTQGERYLVWFLGLAITAVIALFVLNQRIHSGHKQAIREQAEAFQKECAKIQADERATRDEMIRRLIANAEKSATNTADITNAMHALAAKL